MSDPLDFSFTAQLSTPITLDPVEFKGEDQAAVAARIKKMLQDINPAVSYFSDEIDMAAELISSINGA